LLIKWKIFIYGGGYIRPDKDIELDAVYVLSLPGFHWEKATFQPAQARSLHTCNVLGDRNRQMAVIGGSANAVTSVNATGWRDPWSQGIGIFDLSDMEWKDHYDPSAAAYTTPKAVNDWYKQNGQYPSKWDDVVVEGWFTNKGTCSS
jgi:hypothetical protein